jgi:hypothetical protein
LDNHWRLIPLNNFSDFCIISNIIESGSEREFTVRVTGKRRTLCQSDKNLEIFCSKYFFVKYMHNIFVGRNKNIINENISKEVFFFNNSWIRFLGSVISWWLRILNSELVNLIFRLHQTLIILFILHISSFHFKFQRTLIHLICAYFKGEFI